MAFLHDSRRRGPDPYYRWKVAAFTVGAAFGLAGIFTGRDNLILVAVPVLAVGVGLRWLPRRGEPEDSADEAPEDPGAPEDAAGENADSAAARDAADAPRPPASAEGREPRSGG